MPNITEKVIWTVCPYARNGEGSLMFRVYVSPRLTADAHGATLKDKTTWQNWAAYVRKCKFRLSVTGASGPQSALAGFATQMRPDVYASLLPPSTPIQDYVFKNLEGKAILSYPVAKLAGQIESIYADLALQAADNLPKATDLIAANWPYTSAAYRRLGAKAKRTDAQLMTAIAQMGVEGVAQTPEGLLDVFSLFHKPMQHETTVNMAKPMPDNGHEAVSYPAYVTPAKLPSAVQLAEQTDFHKIIAGLANYPELARYCGLILEFEARVPLYQAVNGTLNVALSVIRPGASGPDAEKDSCPVTACVLDNFDFRPVGDPLRFDHRFAVLQKSPMSLVQLDVDGAAHKTIGLANSLPRAIASDFNDDAFQDEIGLPADVGAPTLRTAGMMLAQAGRHKRVETRATAAAKANAAVTANHLPDVLTADDLLRGYRVDVFDHSREHPRWQSLCRRTVTYTLLEPVNLTHETLDKLGLKADDGMGLTATLREDEGNISTGLTSAPNVTDPNVYKLHEGIFAWRGWSLSAPEPFKSLRAEINPEAGPSDEEQHKGMIADTEASVPAGLPLKTVFNAVKGSLPVLRFGHVYSVRLRTVDLCGYSEAFDAMPLPGTVSDRVPYLRYEAIESPVLTLFGDVHTGNDEDISWKTIARSDLPRQGESLGRLALRSYVDKPERSDKSVRRNVAPPRVTQRFAETHSVIDKNGVPDASRYEMLVHKDKGFPSCVMPASDFLNADPNSAGNYSGPTTPYSVSEARFELPYLPDPYAVQICARLRRLGDKGWTDMYIPLYGDPKGAVMPDWPDSRPVTIEGSETFPINYFNFDIPSRTLQIHMNKGCRHKLRLSCMLNAEMLETMALWALMQKSTARGPKQRSAADLKAFILEGKHYMFTPWREIELIHATQKPLVVPAFAKFDVARDKGALDVTFPVLQTPLSGPSTGRLDLDASWDEPDDNPVDIDAKSQPVIRTFKQNVAQVAIQRIDGFFSPYVNTSLSQHFPDTRYRRVSYSMQAISRFKEFFEKSLREKSLLENESAMRVPSASIVRWIKSSAPPPLPGVLYVIPTFGWFRNAASTASRRVGGLRVYLDRPWMSTGFNEMLGVILPDGAAGNTDSGDNDPLVTQWGRDPIRISKDIPTISPKASAFRLAKRQGPVACPGMDAFPDEEGNLPEPFKLTGLTIPGRPGAYSVAAHEVGFDKDRQLWYADVNVAMPKGSYFPFLRLAVARYQPTSVEGCHLSGAVSCDFIQLSADRIAVLIPVGNLGFQYQVFVFGDQPNDGKSGPYARLGAIRIQTQVLDDAALDPVLGWRDEWGTPPKKPIVVIMPDVTPTASPAPDMTPQARQIAAKLASAPVTGPKPIKGKLPRANSAQNLTTATRSDAIVAANMIAPNLLYNEIFYAPLTPAGGKRRVLITETETYPVEPAGNNEEDPLFGERIVYAEAIEF